MVIDFEKLNEYNKEIFSINGSLKKLQKNKFSKVLSLYIKYQEKKLSNVEKKKKTLLSLSSYHNAVEGAPIKILLGQNLKKYADEDINNNLILTLTKLRDSMATHWGYLFPLGRIMDDSNIGENDYEIQLQEGVIVHRGSISEKEREFENPINIIINNLQQMLFEHPDTILSFTNIVDYINIAKCNASKYNDSSVEKYDEYFDSVPVLFLKRILSELLTLRCSIKNINYIIDKIIMLRYYEGKNETQIITRLNKELPKAYEQLYVSDWYQR